MKTNSGFHFPGVNLMKPYAATLPQCSGTETLQRGMGQLIFTTAPRSTQSAQLPHRAGRRQTERPAKRRLPPCSPWINLLTEGQPAVLLAPRQGSGRYTPWGGKCFLSLLCLGGKQRLRRMSLSSTRARSPGWPPRFRGPVRWVFAVLLTPMEFAPFLILQSSNM